MEVSNSQLRAKTMRFLSWQKHSGKGEVYMTWACRSNFSYEGSVVDGTRIFFGKHGQFQEYVAPEEYNQLIRTFYRRKIAIGASQDNPPKGSLGEWLQKNVTLTAIASYVASILLKEGFAERFPFYKIRIIRRV